MELYVNDFVIRSFRDIADEDYISARLNYRYELNRQALWFAEQAIEKYLKAILVFNRVKVKRISHDLEKALQKLRSIPDMSFDFPPNVVEFIEFVSKTANNRYFTRGTSHYGRELLFLDLTVWHIRRYCKFMRQAELLSYVDDANSLSDQLDEIHAQSVKLPAEALIHGGLLEKHLTDKSSKCRQHLIWKNLYFWSRPRRTIKNFKVRPRWEFPTQEVFGGSDLKHELEKYIDF
ncbi:MAG: HEPN domain-containing protein [Pirellulaceae bacterium]|nr:HEPN domain-containing protein [Pirellulaceae bacterium]